MKRTSGWTVESACYGALLVLALLLRMAALGETPLNHEEAVRAWSAWQLVQGAMPQVWDDAATMLTTAGSFLAFGANDALARLVPALAGSSLVLLIWWLRPLLGREAALGAAAMLALSPLTVFLSRSLTGNALFMAASLLFTSALFRVAQGFSAAPGVVTLVALVLLLNGGPLGLGFLLLVAAYLALDWATRPREQALLHRLFPSGSRWREVVIPSAVGVVGFMAVGSGGFVHWQGLGFSSLAAFVRSFDFAPGGLAWYHPLVLLMAYDPLTTVLGLGGCILVMRGWRGAKRVASAMSGGSLGGSQAAATHVGGTLLWGEKLPFHGFLCWWLGWGLVWLLVAGTRRPEHLALVVTPLALLGGMESARFLGSLSRWDWQRIGLAGVASFPLVVFTYLALGWFTKPEIGVQDYQWAAMGMVFVAAIVALAWGIWRGHRGIAIPLSVVALAYLALFQMHSLVSANYPASVAEWLRGPVAPREVRGVTGLAQQALVGPKLRGEVVVEPELAGSLGWYLRGYKNVVWGKMPTPETVAVVRSGGGVSQELPGFTRSVWGLEQQWMPPAFNLEKLWRWLMYRETFGEVKRSFYTVYEKSEVR